MFRACVLPSILFLCALAWGCASTVAAPDSGSVQPVYREQTERPIQPFYPERIRDWQIRTQKEGWSESQVTSVLSEFRSFATYRTEKIDYWDTPGEFIRDGFYGDCEDIAAFMMGTLKRLGYPYGVRILIVHQGLEDHALLKVEMPEGGWIVYDVVPRRVVKARIALLRPIVEFDDRTVDWNPTLVASSRPMAGTNRVALVQTDR